MNVSDAPGTATLALEMGLASAKRITHIETGLESASLNSAAADPMGSACYMLAN